MKKELSTGLKYFYGIGDFGFTLMSNVETFYYNFFLTNICQFSVGVVGTMTLISGIFDMFFSWIAGAVINTLKPRKWGRYRSWLIMTSWICPILMTGQFINWGNTIGAAVIISIFCILSHLFWDFPYVANVSMINVASKSPDDKMALSSIRGTWNNIGSVAFSYLGLPLATVLANVVGEDNMYAALAFVLGILFVVGYYAHFKMFEGYEEIEVVTEKKADEPKAQKEPLIKAITFPLLMLLVADFAKWMVKFVVAATAVYYFTYVAGNVALQATYLLISNLAGVVGAYVAKFIAKKFSTRNTTIIVFLLMAAFLFLGYFMRLNSTAVIAIMSVVQLGYGVVYSCTPALYADAAVYGEWKTGRNATGVIMGLQTMTLKIGILARSVVVAACLAIANFDASIDPSLATDELKSGVSVGFMVIPAVGLIVGAILLFVGFRITKARVIEMQAEIDARKAANA